MKTALAADEPPEPQPSFATGGIVASGPMVTLGTDGCVWPNGPRTVAYPVGNVSVTIDLSRCLAPYRPYRTTTHVGELIREIEV